MTCNGLIFPREGDFVQWISEGVEQWQQPRRLVKVIDECGQLWGFCDGSMTGFRIEQLAIEWTPKI